MQILFITSNRIGDAVLSTGLLDFVIARYPRARITVACGPAAAPLFAATPQVVRVIAMAKEPWGRHWLKLWRQVAARRWSLLIDLRGSILGQFLLAGRRRQIKAGRASEHQVERLARVLNLPQPPAPRIWVSDEHRAEANRLIAPNGAVLGVGPTANWGGKAWAPDRFAAAIERLTGPNGILPGARIAVFGGPDEEAMAAPLLAALAERAPGRAIDLVGKADLLTSYACLERCAFYLGNDSALMHLAAAAGIPTLGLFGPSRETTYGPWGPKAAAVRTDLSYDEVLRQPGYDFRRPESQMASLPVDKVVAAAEALWRRVRAEEAA